MSRSTRLEKQPPQRLSVWNWLLLPLRPWTLWHVAERATTEGAFLAALVCLTALVVPVLGFFFGQINEPYANIGKYLATVVKAMPFAALFGIPFSGACILVLALSGHCCGIGRKRAANQSAVVVRAVLLNHVALAIPLACLSGAIVLSSLGRPSFGLLVSKPAIFCSPLVEALGSAQGAGMFIGLYILNISWALRVGWFCSVRWTREPD